MQADKTTLNDLAILHHDEEQSVFFLLNHTTTAGGKEWLRHFLSHPLDSLDKITQTQQTLQLIIDNESKWTTNITNGTIMVVEKFYDTPVNDIPSQPGFVSSLFYRLTSSQDYSLIRYSVQYFIDFIKGLQQLTYNFQTDACPPVLSTLLERVRMLISRPAIRPMHDIRDASKLPAPTVLAFARYLKHNFKQEALELIEIFSKLDAYYSMAKACQHLGFTFPQIEQTPQPFFRAQQLFHPLLPTPVAYNVELSRDTNFLFLTGANMAGKSTFIKAVGVAVYLAHVGMGVPSAHMQLSLFHGLLSNIQVEDNITRGESYFFNEVQRIKKTIEKINDGRPWLILIDELFKGTNVQDAMRCSTVVIEGLRKLSNALFILSTHLYEISDSLRQYSNIKFNYFETSIHNGQLIFSYTLKEGVSNDRLGYLILQKEGVIDMLNAVNSE